ncbi:unnamed protein product [Adineta steineri]|uniref:Tetratricopeptide repeat protein n=1 Tax=Adineta steineri TaxID=433720 RepID=A0A815K3C0_9BILA|nr:unnamed protein product [Adineta steineri]CAF1610133.1 unnamed protein product [Adineta steineri]
MCEESLQLYQQVFALFIQLYSSDYIDTIYALVNIGDILLDGKENSEQALDFYQKSLTMLERSYPSYYAYIANNFNLIGNVIGQQMKFDQALEIYNRALEYYQQALDINEKCYSSNPVQSASNFILIGNVLSAQEKFDEALAIREKDLSYLYTTVVSNLMDIGRIKVNQINFDGAPHDFCRAVTLLQEYDPLNHSELVIDLEWIASIWNQKHVSIAKTLSILAQVHRKTFLTT